MLAGHGSTSTLLTEPQVVALCQQAFAQLPLDGKRVLGIIPDHTRTAPIGMMFRVAHRLLARRVGRLDFLVALGTHPPMSREAICRRVALSAEEWRTEYPDVRLFNHFWNDPKQLARVGTLSGKKLSNLSNGMMRDDVDVTVNRLLLDYDVAMVIGPTFPHEVVGFSGGNKYFFPGIAGREIIDVFHWLGALLTSIDIIGVKDTPVRHVIDLCTAMLPIERLCLNLVVKEEQLAGLYIDTPEETFSAAADLSSSLHIVWCKRPFEKVLSCAPPMYTDLWTGAKCMYKLEPVVADRGELVVYAPHITEVSVSHGTTIGQIGYHVRDYFLKQMDRFSHIPGGVMAHSTHLKGTGTFEGGVERPRINVVLATGIPREACERLNLGYRDPAAIRPDEWKGRQGEGILLVPRAGEVLYRLAGMES